jgi:hypothetical protein
VRILFSLLGLLALGPQLAAAQEACLSAVRPQVTGRTEDTCRIQAAVSNACGTPVRYVIVRAVPHPQRGPLPTQTATVARFGLQPLTLEREMCNQAVRLLELSGDGTARDFTERPIQPATPLAQIEPEAQRVNACVARCSPPITDRNAILAELRDTYRHALDDNEGAAARDAIVDAMILEREGRDRVCARICHGALSADEAPTQLRALETTRNSSIAGPAATLATLAARPPRRATPEPVMPAIGRALRGAGVGRQATSRCRQTARGPRCSLVLDLGPNRGSARQGRQRRSEVRGQSRRGEIRQQQRRRRR